VNDKDQYVRIVVIHKDLQASESATITISMTGSYESTASLTRLVAPSVTSQFGLNLAGQTFDHSQDGTPLGEKTSDSINVNGEGQFVFTIDPLSVAFLEVRPQTLE